MKKRLGVVLITPVLILVFAAAAPPVAAANPNTPADGIVKVLTKVFVSSSGAVAPAGSAIIAAGGEWNAGCRMAGYDGGTLVYTYTLWQNYSSNGSSITRPVPPPTFTNWSSYGWVLTSAPQPIQWWVTQFTTLADQGNFTFTQYFFGLPVKSSSGWVQITVRANGTWSCNGQ